MAERRSFGLTSIEIGTAEQFTTMAVLGVTYQDTATLQQEEDPSTEHYSEEHDDPEIIVSSVGKKTLSFSIIDTAPDTLVQVLGGTVTTVSSVDTWNAPDASTNIEKAIRITTKDGSIIKIARAKITAKINFEFKKQGLLKVDISARVLFPATGGMKSITIT